MFGKYHRNLLDEDEKVVECVDGEGKDEERKGREWPFPYEEEHRTREEKCADQVDAQCPGEGEGATPWVGESGENGLGDGETKSECECGNEEAR